MTPTLHYVLRNKQAIGFLLSAGPKGFRAFDQEGLPIGLFEDEDGAARAVYEKAGATLSSQDVTQRPTNKHNDTSAAPPFAHLDICR